MAFTDNQLRRLRARLNSRHVKSRKADGTTLHYLEGWHLLAEANRIFGFDGWDREMVDCHCVCAKQLGSRFTTAYTARVRITVHAGENRIIREGLGAGEATTATLGESHAFAAKAAETDATKRALSTFGNAFGLSLYSGTPEPSPRQAATRLNGPSGNHTSAGVDPGALNGSGKNPLGSVWVPQPVDKSTLTRSEPKRLRDWGHLRFVANECCLICDRKPSHAHHLTFTQPNALGRKVSDEFTVPLCNLHHASFTTMAMNGHGGLTER